MTPINTKISFSNWLTIIGMIGACAITVLLWGLKVEKYNQDRVSKDLMQDFLIQNNSQIIARNDAKQENNNAKVLEKFDELIKVVGDLKVELQNKANR